MLKNKELTYGDIYNMFVARHEALKEYICDYRPAGYYRLQIWFKNNLSIFVTYEIDKNIFKLK